MSLLHPHLPPFDVSHTFRKTHDKIPFEIVHWGVERASGKSLNNGKGCWNYYIYLLESEIENFSDFWLEPELKEFSSGGTKYLHHDYYSSPLYNIHWHCGITFWEGTDLIPNRRSIKIGCDYSHLYDEQRGYDTELSDVYADVLKTISELLPLLKFKTP